MHKTTLGILAGAALWAASLHGAAPRDLAADMVMAGGGQAGQTVKLYVSGQKSRMEWSTMGGMVAIARRDRGVTWVLYPSKKQYLERPISSNAMQDPAADPPGVIKKVRAGTETVGGYSCTKYILTVAAPGGRQLTATSWVSEALGLAMKSEFMGMTTELRNIRLGAQPASLFEILAGWQKTNTPVTPPVQLPSNLSPGTAERLRQAVKQSGPAAGATSANTAQGRLAQLGEKPGLLGRVAQSGSAVSQGARKSLLPAASGGAAKTGFPSWVPAYHNTTKAQGGGDESNGTVVFTTGDTIAQVLDFYEGALKEAGFTVTRRETAGLGATMSAANGDRKVFLKVTQPAKVSATAQINWATGKK